MKNTLVRFRPYLRTNDVILFERVREATGVSLGNILMGLLVESETFVKLSECKDATDQELNEIFIGLYSSKKCRQNKEKKEEKCNIKK